MLEHFGNFGLVEMEKGVKVFPNNIFRNQRVWSSVELHIQHCQRKQSNNLDQISLGIQWSC